MKNNEQREMPINDMELVLFYIRHIKTPCTDQSGNDIRNFYITEATRILDTITNSAARELLQNTIKEFSE